MAASAGPAAERLSCQPGHSSSRDTGQWSPKLTNYCKAEVALLITRDTAWTGVQFSRSARVQIVTVGEREQ